MSSFIIINQENLNSISAELACGKGRVLIANPGYQSYQDNVVDARFDLYDHPLIEENTLFTRHGHRKINNENWQTGWQKDREYILRLRQTKSENPTVNFCRLLHNSLTVGSYEFNIGFQSKVSMWPFPQGIVCIYIPKEKKINSAFAHALKSVISQMKEGKELLLQESVINEIVNYVKEDLVTSKTFRNNVSAGLQADMITGLS